MPNPTTSIKFSASTPSAPAGFQNVKPLDTGSAPLDSVAFSVPSTGGVSQQTANYTAAASDCGKLIVFNSASAVTLTLPAVPFPQWSVSVANLGAGALTITPGTLDLDGAAVSISVGQYEGVRIATDGVNYFTERGLGGSGGGGAGGNVLNGSGPPFDDTGNFAFVQSSGGGTFSSNVTAGNLLIVALSSGGSTDPLTVTDTVGTTYQKIAVLNGHTANIAIYAGIANASGANTVTTNLPGPYPLSFVAEFAGVTLTVDASMTVYNTSQHATASITTTNASDLLLGFLRTYAPNDSFALSSGLTSIGQSTVNPCGVLFFEKLTAAGTYSPVITVDSGSGSGDYPTALVAFTLGTVTVNPSLGDFYFDVTNRVLYGPWTGSAWEDTIALFANPMTAEGDLIVGGTGGAATRLAAGAAGTVLVSSGPGQALGWGTVSGGGGTLPDAISQSPDFPPSVSTPYDDEFTDGALNARWSWINQGGASANVAKSFLGLICPSPGSGDNWHLLAQAAPAPPWEFTLCWLWNGSTEANYLYAGLAVCDSTSGRMTTLHIDNANLQVVNWNSPTSFNGNAGFGNAWPRPGRHYVKVKDDGTNLIFSYSRDGVNYWQLCTVARTSFLSTPDHIAIGAGTNIGAGQTMILSADWFRRTL